MVLTFGFPQRTLAITGHASRDFPKAAPWAAPADASCAIGSPGGRRPTLPEDAVLQTCWRSGRIAYRSSGTGWLGLRNSGPPAEIECLPPDSRLVTIRPPPIDPGELPRCDAHACGLLQRSCRARQRRATGQAWTIDCAGRVKSLGGDCASVRCRGATVQ